MVKGRHSRRQRSVRMGFSLHNSGLKTRKLERAPVVRTVAVFQQYWRWNYVNKTREERKRITIYCDAGWIRSVLYILNSDTFCCRPVSVLTLGYVFSPAAHICGCMWLMKCNWQECVECCHTTGCERLARPATELTALQMVVRRAGKWQFRSSLL
jgi:hypothetical protein